MKFSDIENKFKDEIVGIISKGTGEVTDVEDNRPSIVTPVKKPRRRTKSSDYGMFFLKAYQILAQSKPSRESMTVFIWMMGNLRFNNHVKLTQEEIGDALGMQKQNVSRAMRSLQASGLIEKVGPGEWLLDSSTVWRGSKMDLAREHQRTAARHIAKEKKIRKKAKAALPPVPEIIPSPVPVVPKSDVDPDDIFSTPSPMPEGAVMVGGDDDTDYQDFKLTDEELRDVS